MTTNETKPTMTTNHDTTNEVAPTKTTMTQQEIDRRIAIACRWTWDDEINGSIISPTKPLLQVCLEYRTRLDEKTNEVARLREGKDKIAEIAWEAVNRLFDVSDSLDEIPLKLQTQLEALGPIPTLAPAPEEAVNPTCANTQHKFSHCDCKEPAPEWRELGPDEEIQAEDKYRSDVSLTSWPVSSVMVGKLAGNFPEYSFRTCRPLPKQEGEQPYCSRCKYNHAFPCEGSLAGAPLEDELKDIDQYADKQNDFHTCRVFQSIEYSLHYLRDEIQKLKEAKP